MLQSVAKIPYFGGNQLANVQINPKIKNRIVFEKIKQVF
jgi:hypothetical protein